MSDVLPVTRYTTPGFNIKRAFKDGEVGRALQKRHPGWSRVYMRVAVDGRIRRGESPTLERHDVVARPEVTGRHLLHRLGGLADLPAVGAVRGLGLMAAVEIVQDRATKAP